MQFVLKNLLRKGKVLVKILGRFDMKEELRHFDLRATASRMEIPRGELNSIQLIPVVPVAGEIDTFAKNCRVYGILELSISAVLGSGYMTHI